MDTIIAIIHVVVCLFLVVIVLLQHGKGADIGATFGGGNTVFGTEGPVSLLNKVTTAAAIIFMLTSITLAYLSAKSGSRSVMQNVPLSATVPAVPPLETGPVKVPLTSDGSSQPAPASFPGQAAPAN